MDCQTEKSDLSNAIKYITNSVRISIKNERKKKKKP